MSKHTPFILVFTALITACGVDDAKETTSSTSQGIGDPYCWDQWGDPIYDDGDYDNFMVTYDDCYYWEDPGGGGGNTCWWPTNYYGNGDRQFDSEEQARTTARSDALNSAQNQCLASGWSCMPFVQSFNVTDSCVQPTPGVAIWRCSASATVTCVYQ